MLTCNEVLISQRGVVVCEETLHSEHTHDDEECHSRSLLPGEIVGFRPSDETLQLLTPVVNSLCDFIKAKAEAGKIQWENDAPVLFGFLEQLEEFRVETPA